MRFEEDTGLHLIQYNPHYNCHRVAEFCGVGEFQAPCTFEDGESSLHYVLPDGRLVPAGHWILRTDDGFEVYSPDELIDRIMGTTRTRLEG